MWLHAVGYVMLSAVLVALLFLLLLATESWKRFLVTIATICFLVSWLVCAVLLIKH